MCGLSVTHLRRLFHTCTGMTLTEHQTRLRIHRAYRMLIKGAQRVGAISASLRYENTSYFSRVFRKNMGISPKKYQSEQFL